MPFAERAIALLNLKKQTLLPKKEVDDKRFENDHAKDISFYLKNFQQRIHVEPAYPKGHAEHCRHDDEDQQKCEPHGEGDAQEHAD